VTNSSAQQTYSITLDNNIGIIAQDVSDISDTIVLSVPDTTGNVYIGTTTGYSNIGTVSISNIDTTEYTINWGNEEWVNSFPEWSRIEEMCKEYPGLKIAFEKFKTTYKLVKDDYDTPRDKRKKP
jgi:hypothetical protein